MSLIAGLFTLEYVAVELGESVPTVRRRIQRGELEARKVLGRLVVDEAEVHALRLRQESAAKNSA